jgi:cobalt-precorrin 5A hydrolase
MNIALISLSDEGAQVIGRLQAELDKADIYLHETVSAAFTGRRFRSVVALTAEIFDRYGGLVYAAPCGVVVRALAKNIRHKKTDPGVVVVDVGARFAVSLLGGHEGGANSLAVTVSNILGAEPVITTTTEALKQIIVGIGCRRGVQSEAIIQAIQEALRQAGEDMRAVRLLASADIKRNEPGLLEAARLLGISVRFIDGEEIRASARAFTPSDFVRKKVSLPAVAEPAALLAGRRTQLILPRIKIGGVTVALARESFSWSASVPEAP